MTFAKKALIFGSLALLGANSAAFAADRLNGSGATFPADIYTKWFAGLAKSGGPKVNYQSVGSGAGRKAFIDETVSFAASDDPISAKDKAKVSRGVVQIPTVGGTIALGYNYPGCNLKITQKQVVSVFMGSIDDWKELGCKPGKITVVHRSDGSGTTAAFTDSLSTFSKEWTLGSAKSVNWKVGVGGKGNEGVSGVVSTTPGTIGYMSQSFVKGAIKAAAVQNKAGQFVLPGFKSGKAALSGITLDRDLAGGNPNPSASGAYPITTLTYLLLYKTGNGAKTDALKQMLNYILSDKVQAQADDLGFVPLSEGIQAQAKAAVDKISQ
ncbi:phosphate ABC transporter substrate-binding protein PstS [Cyanobium sp. WAJ14-Wanaka]|uniref:phosphate ABC transporter substrate-binding protein PstS n=1 Tax=Cyanobium sp. WAJ14-Wanaka TaxID=2823725 RepID=UPI0020CC30CE|nr:phosphate ABC transporter substrate-binding protein PstS [Cyanobium sp. WAJ14-Wanaka]MCP9774910.1 phosphate ABC transporter substrate-binding protein PstS [Cyanobium sp. WAJ14-Wanaka]